MDAKVLTTVIALILRHKENISFALQSQECKVGVKKFLGCHANIHIRKRDHLRGKIPRRQAVSGKATDFFPTRGSAAILIRSMPLAESPKTKVKRAPGRPRKIQHV